MKRLIAGSTTTGSTSADTGLLIVRVVTGLALTFAHGIGKMPPAAGFITRVGEMGFPAPTLFAWLAAIAEFAGGILIALGLLTRPAALLVAGHFALVVLIAHAGDDFGAREKRLLFAVVALMLFFTGPGRYSVDALIRGKPE